MFEIEPKQNVGLWAVYLYSKGTRRFYEWADDARLQELLERHRQNGNTIEFVEKEPEFRWRGG